MSWKKIGAASRKVTDKLQQPFAVVICFSEPLTNAEGVIWSGVVTFNRPRYWKPNADQQLDVRKACAVAARQIRGHKLLRGRSYFIWDNPVITTEMDKTARRIARTKETMFAWCRGKYYVPIGIMYTHAALEAVQ